MYEEGILSNMTNIHNMEKIEKGTKGKTAIKRFGFYSALAVVMVLVLAACGTDGTTGSGTGSETGQISVPAVEATATAAMSPQATSTAALPEAARDATATTASDAGAQAGSSTEIQATLREWAIDLSAQEAPTGKITFVVTNQGQMAHNFTVLSDTGTVAKVPNFRAANGPQTLEVDLQPGTYTIICDLPGHAQRGQKTQLVVK
jgi:uncharacterized cupredoxin-like copper-binding protein